MGYWRSDSRRIIQDGNQSKSQIPGRSDRIDIIYTSRWLLHETETVAGKRSGGRIGACWGSAGPSICQSTAVTTFRIYHPWRFPSLLFFLFVSCATATGLVGATGGEPPLILSDVTQQHGTAQHCNYKPIKIADGSAELGSYFPWKEVKSQRGGWPREKFIVQQAIKYQGA